MTVKWTGKAISENKWHCIRHVYKNVKGTMKKIPVIASTSEYQTFVESLSVSIMAKARKHNMIGLESVDLRLQCEISNGMDDQNLLKPVCDAIERAGVVKNDRNIGTKTIVPGKRHKSSEQDTLWIIVSIPPV